MCIHVYVVYMHIYAVNIGVVSGECFLCVCGVYARYVLLAICEIYMCIYEVRVYV